jgi:transcriptional regulator with XRE-family HTH domain
MRKAISSRRQHAGTFAEALRDARQRKGWSQRELGARAHMTQAQISRIENSEVDLQLSSLVELARTLDLDVQLIPRTALTAVEATVRAAEERSGEREIKRTFEDVRRRAEALHQAHPGPDLLDLGNIARELERLTPRLQIPLLPGEVEQAVRDLAALRIDSLGRPAGARRVKDITEILRHFRGHILHAAKDERPAYALDGGDV